MRIKVLVESTLPTKFGSFNVIAVQSEYEHFPHLIFYKSGYEKKDIVDVRIHSECMTGEVFGSTKCECAEQLDYSMKWVQDHPGIIVYLRQEGRGIGLVEKLKAYNLQEKGFNTLEANLELGFHSDLRDYSLATQLLEDLKISKIRLITNNPDKIKAFDNSKIEVVERIPIEIKPKPENLNYLATKKDYMGHMISLDLDLNNGSK